MHRYSYILSGREYFIRMARAVSRSPERNPTARKLLPPPPPIRREVPALVVSSAAKRDR